MFEGCDRVGKSTQCRMLVEALNSGGGRAQLMKFPDRTTAIGKQINAYLNKEVELEDHSVHLLFAANRWELVPEIKRILLSGTSLVVDRYAFSGVAFTAAKKIAPLEWCKAPDIGLPAPDLVFYLKLSAKAAEQRAEFGSERYESKLFQEKVERQFEALRTGEWHVLDASRDIESLHSEVMRTAEKVIEDKANSPISPL